MSKIIKPDLTLIIDRENFNEILSGKKKEEYRSITDYYISRFCVFKGNEFVAMKPIKTIALAVGYDTDRDMMIISVKGIFIDTFENEIPENFKKGDQAFTIEIDKILSKRVKA